MSNEILFRREAIVIIKYTYNFIMSPVKTLNKACLSLSYVSGLYDLSFIEYIDMIRKEGIAAIFSLPFYVILYVIRKIESIVKFISFPSEYNNQKVKNIVSKMYVSVILFTVYYILNKIYFENVLKTESLSILLSVILLVLNIFCYNIILFYLYDINIYLTDCHDLFDPLKRLLYTTVVVVVFINGVELPNGTFLYFFLILYAVFAMLITSLTTDVVMVISREKLTRDLKSSLFTLMVVFDMVGIIVITSKFLETVVTLLQ